MYPRAFSLFNPCALAPFHPHGLVAPGELLLINILILFLLLKKDYSETVLKYTKDNLT